MTFKIRPAVGAVSALILASAFCVYRVNSQEAPSQSQMEQESSLTPEQRLRVAASQAKLKDAIQSNYRAKLNNGSKRKGLTLDQLPEKVRDEAKESADQYKGQIYPALKKYVAAHNGLLPEPAFTLPEFAPYMQDMEYKGTGPKSYGRGSWAIGIGFRPDGTIVARDVYSSAPPEAPHDVWANLNKFANYPILGKGFMINGWDDGRVTFDPVEQNFYGIGRDMEGRERPYAVAPGQAGIPPEFKSGLKSWFKQLDKKLDQAQQSAKKQAELNQSKAKASTPSPANPANPAKQ